MRRFWLRIVSIWCAIVFIVVYLLIFPFHVILLLLKKEWANDLSHRLNTIWGTIGLLSSGVYVKSINRGKVNPKGVYIFAPNHSSYLDIPVCNIAILNSFRYLGKAELSRVPLFGFMFSRLHIPVNRGSVTASFRSFQLAAAKLQAGRSMLIFPEGTIPDKSQVTLLKFKDGAFRLAIENKVPVVPMAILGADRALADNGKWLLQPTTIRVVFGDPIETAEMSLDETPALRDKVYDWMHAQLTQA